MVSELIKMDISPLLLPREIVLATTVEKPVINPLLEKIFPAPLLGVLANCDKRTITQLGPPDEYC